MHSVRFAFVCLAAILLTTHSLAQCPTASFIKPCSCKTADFGSLVTCSHIADAQPIRWAMNVLDGYNVVIFTWQKVDIKDPLPADFFSGMTVKQLNIIDSKFSFSPDDLPFDGLASTLSSLYLTNNSEIKFPGMRLKHLQLLTEINVMQLHLPVVRTEWIQRYPDNLQILKLENCEISEVEPEVFRYLFKLQILSLANNKITSITRAMIPYALIELNLNNNLLTSLPPGFFGGMSKLRRVYLSKNQLTQIPFDPWVKVWEDLEGVWLSENPINCTDKVKWICYERVPTILEGTCTAPSKLAGVKLANLRENLFG